jgi:hypothetical protein
LGTWDVFAEQFAHVGIGKDLGRDLLEDTNAFKRSQHSKKVWGVGLRPRSKFVHV